MALGQRKKDRGSERETREASADQRTQLEHTVRTVNNATNSNYSLEELQQNPEQQQQLLAPSEETVRQEAEVFAGNLEQSGLTEQQAREQADHYTQLRLNSERSAQENVALSQTTSTAHLTTESEGAEREQHTEANALWMEAERKAADSGYKDENAIKTRDLFYAYATTADATPEAIKKLSEDHPELKKMFMVDLGLAAELTRKGESAEVIHSQLNKERSGRLEVILKNPETKVVLQETGMTPMKLRANLLAQENNEIISERFAENGDVERQEQHNRIIQENKDDPAKMAELSLELAKGSGYFNEIELANMENSLEVIRQQAMDSTEAEGELEEETGAQVQLINDIRDLSFDDQQRANDIAAMDAELSEKAEEEKEEEEEAESPTEQLEHIDELKNGQKEIPQGSGNYLGPFYKDPMEVVKQNNSKFTPQVMETLVAKNFNETVFIAKNGDVDFSEPERPESVVMEYFRDPENEEKKESFMAVLKEDNNVSVRAAVYEALARTAVEVAEREE